MLGALLRKLPQARWKRVLIYFATAGVCLFVFLVVAGVTLYFVFRAPERQAWLFRTFFVRQLQTFPNEPVPAPAPGAGYTNAEPSIASAHAAGDVFQATHVWRVHLRFTTQQWAELGPNRIPVVATNWMQPDGKITLSNPAASRHGLIGMLGLDFPWSRADFEMGGARVTNTPIRYKGNGTFLGVMRSYKRPFKIDLKRADPPTSIAGRTTFNFHNLSADRSHLSDALAYELFRDAGVPAPRTAFARVFLTIDGKFDRRLLGVYALIENPDAEWAAERFGPGRVTLFKPVTYDLFRDLGDDWAAYDRIYDPKTPLEPPQGQRVIEFAKLLTHAKDDEFAARLPDYLDEEECARFLACEAMLSNFDGILCMGQNFLMYVDHPSGRIGFIPWDLDHSWGEFPFIGSSKTREQLSIKQPWVGEHRLLERLMAVERFRERYRAELRRLADTLFTPERLGQRVDALAAVVRPAIAEESAKRLDQFEVAVGDPEPLADGQRDGNPMDENRPVHQLKRFIAARAQSVRDQLAGTAEGVVMQRNRP